MMIQVTEQGMLNNSPKKRTKTKAASRVKYVLNAKDSVPLKGWKIDSALDPGEVDTAIPHSFEIQELPITVAKRQFTSTATRVHLEYGYTQNLCTQNILQKELIDCNDRIL